MKKINLKSLKPLLPAVAAGVVLCASAAHAQLISEGVNGSATFSSDTVTTTGLGTPQSEDSSESWSISVGSNVIDTGYLTTSVYTANQYNSLNGGSSASTLGGLVYVYTLQITEGNIQSIGLSSTDWGSTVEVGIGSGSDSGIAGSTYVTDDVTFSATSMDPVGVGIYTVVVATSGNNSGAATAFLQDSGQASPQDLDPAPVPEASTIMAGMLMLLPLGIGAIRAVRKERSV